jgi:hypothetical protein
MVTCSSCILTFLPLYATMHCPNHKHYFLNLMMPYCFGFSLQSFFSLLHCQFILVIAAKNINSKQGCIKLSKSYIYSKKKLGTKYFITYSLYLCVKLCPFIYNTTSYDLHIACDFYNRRRGRLSLDLFWIKRYEGQVMQANIQILFKNLTENVGKFEEGVDRALTCSESNVMKVR